MTEPRKAPTARTAPTPPTGPAGLDLLPPQDLVESALRQSRSDACVVIVASGSAANLRWANSTATTNGVSRSLTWWVVAIQDGAAGTVAGSAADAGSTDAVAAVVRAAESAARSAAERGPARDFLPLLEPDSGPEGTPDAPGAGFEAPPEATSFAVFDAMLPTLAAAFSDARSAGTVLYGFARHELSTTYLGTSTGVRRRWTQPTGTVELNAKSADLSRSSWAGRSTPDFAGVDVQAMARDLGRRLQWATRRIDLPAGRYDTVLPPTAVADFLIPLVWGAGARAAVEGRSAFSRPGGGTRLGERLSPHPLTLAADPSAPGLSTAPFLVTTTSDEDVAVFDNGAPVARTDVLADGVLARLVTTRRSAAELGLPFTPLADNLVLDGGTPDRGILDLVTGLDRGLLVTSQWYLREVDPQTMLTTGVTRDGVFLVEHGEIAGAVPNFRFNVSPLDVLRQAREVGGTEPTLSREWSDWFTRTAMPPILVEDFNMSSVSRAQ